MRTVWHHLDRPELGFLDQLSYTIFGAELSMAEPLTPVRGGHGIIIVSDYSPGRTGGPFECMSFLLVDPRSCSAWNRARLSVRAEWLADGRRMSYKALGDKRRAGALVPFLLAADGLAGILVTVAMPRDFMTESCLLESALHVCGADFSAWKPRTLARLDAIAKLGALLVAGLAGPGQDIIWVTDEDEFAVSDDRVTQATKLVGHYINHLSPILLGHIRFGATNRVEDGRLTFEDLSAVCDLAAGASAVVLNEELRLDVPLNRGLKRPMSGRVPEKSRRIVGWLSWTPGDLSTLALYIKSMPGGACRTGALTLDPLPADPRILRPR